MMKTIDDLLTVVPGLRRVRSINADWLATLLNRGPKECIWCGGVVPKRRRSWCSDGCVDAFKLRCDANRQRQYVEHRDSGVCQVCQRDTYLAEREGKVLAKSLSYMLIDDPKRDEVKNQLRQNFGYARGRWREVDHIVPVVRGGGLCDISNLRLVCGVCHAELTKILCAK